MVSTFVANQKLGVQIEHEYDYRSFEAEVLQDTVLLLLLFEIYTADIPEPKDCNTANLTQFEDDTAPLAQQ